jgi:hypothetical protein
MISIFLLLILNFPIQTPPLSPSHVYIVARATNTKAGLTAKDFNARDTVITHVGLGFYHRKKFFVAHVEDRPANAFEIITLEQFCNRETFYLAIYKLPFPKPTEKAIRKFLINHPRVEFDYHFNLNNQRLYCSEFIMISLVKLFPHLHLPPPRFKKLDDPLKKAFLQTDTLHYYSVDFFLAINGIELIYEKWF